ncbi:class I SAM-dependent methyltransferase [Zhongshania sp.]|uniref:class I SAM-dependent methyltransferase n=1 Tax=Zhongshania sp. TaxID=1971902 RepID=UPI0039E5868E
MNDKAYEDAIVKSWYKNVDAWTNAVRDAQISSRVTVTDAAIVNAVVARSPASVLDLGCGEGWLARALTDLGLSTVGLDVVPDLIAKASARGGKFKVLSYQEFAAGKWSQQVDCVVCNFSLLGKELVGGVLRAMPAVMGASGHCIIQTLHPAYVGEPYCDGWRQGSWAGFSSDFVEPPPWYFRTLSSWLSLFADCGLHLKEFIEPLNTDTGQPASLIFVLASAGKA